MRPPGRVRIVLVHSSDEHYGSDRVVLDVLRALDRRTDTDVIVLVPDDTPHGRSPLCAQIARHHPNVTVEHGDVPVVRRTQRSPLAMIALTRRVLRLTRRLRAIRPDLVWCATSATLPAAIAARAARAPSVVVHVHEIWAGPSRLALRQLARLTTGCVVVSTAVERAARLGKHPCTVVLNAVPIPAEHARCRTVGEPLRFLVASRWGWWKGHATLLAAWSRAGSPGLLTILGARPPSGGGVDVRRLAGDSESISIDGEVDDIGPHLDRSDVLILPSERPEPFGLVIIEAFARGVPVIATNAGGVPEIVTHDVDGWLVEPGDIDMLAARLATLRAVDIARAGARATTTHRTRFTTARFDAAINEAIETQLRRAADTKQRARRRRTPRWRRTALHTAP